jgi:formate-dependent phosphoribosylglycinamide formyltransferase (GAR transformylase)
VITNKNYCLLLGLEKSRERALLGAVRATNAPVALLLQNGTINGNRFADIVIPGNPEHPEQTLAAVRKFEEKWGVIPVSVIPLTEMTINSAQVIASHYNLPFFAERTTKQVRHKDLMKKAFQAFNLPVTKFAHFTSFEELQFVAQDFNYPIVLKPANSGGSEGVSRVDSINELRVGYNRLTDAVKNYVHNFQLSDCDYQVEEYIEATHEISVEVLNSKNARTVLAVTDKYLTKPPYFVELGHSMPSIFSDNAEYQQIALKACDALSIDKGIAHVEMRINASGKATLLEVNARTPGDNIPVLFEQLTGISMFELHCKSFIYDKVEVPPIRFQGRAAIAFINPEQGYINKINYPKQDELPKDAISLDLLVKPGNEVGPFIHSGCRSGFMEFYWREDQGKKQLKKHLIEAKRITTSLFEMEAIKQTVKG